MDFLGAKVAILLGPHLLVTLRDDRSDIPYPNQWDLPGGGRESGESPFACVRRETLEEVGLDLPEAAVLWSQSFPDHGKSTEVNWFFVARLPADSAGKIRFGDEGQGWALVTPAAYRTLPAAIPHLRDRFFLWFDAQ